MVGELLLNLNALKTLVQHFQVTFVRSDIVCGVSLHLLQLFPMASMTPVHSLQLPDGDQSCAAPVWRRSECVQPQQSRVHGEGAAEQRGLPTWGLRRGCSPVHQCPAGRPAELHPVQQPLCSPPQTGAPPGGAGRCRQSMRAQPQVAKGQ